MQGQKVKTDSNCKERAAKGLKAGWKPSRTDAASSRTDGDQQDGAFAAPQCQQPRCTPVKQEAVNAAS